MSVRNSLRALPTLLRVGFSEAVAYRAELFIWILATTMPLIMLALWSAVAAEGPVGRYDQPRFVAYFLATFIVRQVTSSWAAYQMNWEVRHGLLSMRLLRPVHPVASYAAENLAALPLRLAVALPAAIIALLVIGPSYLPSGLEGWTQCLLATVGAWVLGFCTNVFVGCISFYIESSLRVMDVWLVLFFVFSGYLLPVELFPPNLRTLVDWLPLRYQLGLPVEILTGAQVGTAAWSLIARQWGWVIIAALAAYAAWKRGLRYYEAYGG